jgi:predicted O-methyltransferase YrrM
MPLWRDPSFDALIEACPHLDPMRSHLPADLVEESFDGQSRIATLQSSYKDHGYGVFLYALARALRPSSCVELGVYQGLSLLSVASALRDNGHGTIVGFDLFEDYPYRHESH